MIFGGWNPSTFIDYPGKIACMVYTIGCNFRCPYCHNPELVDETADDTFTEEYVLSVLRERCGLLDGLVITGGEPTMHGDALRSFILKVKELGFLVKLDTNGTNPQFLEDAFADGIVDYVAMDIKAPLESYYKTVGRPVDPDTLQKSINLIMKSGVSYEFRTTIIKALLTPEDIDSIVQSVAGAEHYYLQKFIPTKILNPQFKRKVTYSDNEFEQFKKNAEKYVMHCGIR